MLATKLIKKGVLVFLFLALYLVSSVPVGLFLYSLKSDIGINIFSKTGFHSYLQCLQNEAYLARIKENNDKRQNGD